MGDVAESVGAALASRSSRRGFIAFAGRAALGVALALNGSSLAYASDCPCVCSGDPCPCDSGCELDCENCPLGGGCSGTCTSGGSWNCCVDGCVWVCSECCCSGFPCTCFTRTCDDCGGGQCGPCR